VSAGGTSEDVVIAAARAVGRALRMGVRYDERRGGKIASSKGTLTL
jgi:imidazoleglycerol phosphate dehydratase HisB